MFKRLQSLLLRDYFAAHALTGIIAQTPTAERITLFASKAYLVADSMLEIKGMDKEELRQLHNRKNQVI